MPERGPAWPSAAAMPSAYCGRSKMPRRRSGSHVVGGQHDRARARPRPPRTPLATIQCSSIMLQIDASTVSYIDRALHAVHGHGCGGYAAFGTRHGLRTSSNSGACYVRGK